MYKFTNGIVVFDEETRDKYIKAGYILVKEEKNDEVEVEDEPKSTEYKREYRDIRKNKRANG